MSTNFLIAVAIVYLSSVAATVSIEVATQRLPGFPDKLRLSVVETVLVSFLRPWMFLRYLGAFYKGYFRG